LGIIAFTNLLNIFQDKMPLEHTVKYNRWLANYMIPSEQSGTQIPDMATNDINMD